MPRLDAIPVAYEIVIDNSLESLIVLDAGNRIVDLNPKAQNLICHPMSEAIGKPSALD
jgi:PAS domain-containing protein